LNTIDEAQAYLLANIEDGAECPCCARQVRLYRRKLNSNMVAFLCDLVGSEAPWTHYMNVRFRGRDYSYLQLWDLAETCTEEGGGYTGLWRPTERGIAFARREIRVPSHVYHYLNVAHDFAATTVDVEEALGSRFDYAELMKGV